MGYYTNYRLTIENGPEDEIWDFIEKDDELRYYLHKEYADSSKWYEHDEDMAALSKTFPDAVFHLRGEGEESGDIWEKHYKNGKVQVCRAEIVIPPYNPNWDDIGD